MLSVHLFLCFHSIRSNIYRRNINRRCVLTPFLSNVCWNWTRPAHTEKKIWSSSSNTKKRARDGVKKLKRYAAQHTLLNMSAHSHRRTLCESELQMGPATEPIRCFSMCIRTPINSRQNDFLKSFC